MKESLRKRQLAVWAAIAVGAVSLVGCGENNAQVVSSSKKAGPTPKYEYTADGKRLTSFDGGNDYYGEYGALALPDILSWCDGPDLMDQETLTRNGSGGSANRSPNHQACADGKLTTEDFQLPQ